MITWPYILRAGHSPSPSDAGACAMDAVNWLAHGKHGDAPECASPVIAAFVIVGNDSMPDDVRQRLLPYLHRIAGSRSLDHEAARLHVLVLAALRVFAPLSLDLAGLHKMAIRLRALPDDVSTMTAVAAAKAAAKAAARSGFEASETARRVWMKLQAPMHSKEERLAWRTRVAAEGAKVAAETVVWAIDAAFAASKALELGFVATIEEIAATQSSAARGSAMTAHTSAKTSNHIGQKESTSAVWDAYFATLDAALSAGPQGEPWSADVLRVANDLYRAAGGLVTVNTEGAAA